MRKFAALLAVIFAVTVSVNAFASDKPKHEAKEAKHEAKEAKHDMKEAKKDMKEAKTDAKKPH